MQQLGDRPRRDSVSDYCFPGPAYPRLLICASVPNGARYNSIRLKLLKGRICTLALRDKVVIVTGASSGIGEATAREMAARGARVVVIAEHGDNLDTVAKSINASGGCAVPVVADFSKPECVQGLVQTVEESAGPVDILVNNAGVGMQALVGERPMEDIRYLFEVELFCYGYTAVSDAAAHGTARIRPHH